ncbi:NAD(P)/FAD-dependent oxidoreductase [Rhodococcus sp. KBS0724]|uniref:flavin-containing monooxygenase n=1 Tax=Rhodococcus sp. KBS0724 TaxID=1179674 RepID=UPI00110D2BB7|nr:NAD(P)/FAD-dependent oxidoreductase [Rhodococcus sp. KBS0724]TSD40252.1 NAD(P)/FAD-dependent oxidoreductase [Rhodococcus sp. KBS0724]
MTNHRNERHAEIVALLRDGDAPSQLLTLCELTEDLSFIERWGSHITGANPWDHTFTDTALDAIHGHLADAILDCDMATEPAQPLVDTLLDHARGAVLPAAEHAMLYKEMGLFETGEVEWSADRPYHADEFRVLIIGAGLSGIVAARRFKRLGIAFEVVEKSDNSGGTWHHNTYPGCGVDIASHYFSYSFAPNSQWERYYAKQPEILAYLRRCVETEKLSDSISYNTEVLSAEWSEHDRMWLVTTRTADGRARTIRANIVVSATGLLHRPSIPDLPGLADFEGPYFHAAEWDHSVKVEGKRVALIGTGASGNQIGPAVAPVVENLTVFQRSPQWNVGVQNYSHDVSAGEKWLLANVPAYARWFRARTLLSQNDVMRPAQTVDPTWNSDDGSISAENARMREALTQYIVDELGDRQDLLPKVLPDYPPFTKRMLRDNGWYRMLRRENVELVNCRTPRFDGDAIIDDDGQRHPVDVAVFATGFEASKMLASYSIYGRGGQSIRDVWGDDDPRAYLGMTVPGFPNFFIMYGPNTNIGTGGSIFFQAEVWSRYIADMVKTMIERDVDVIEVTEHASNDYNHQLDQRLGEMVWSVSPAGTWYRNSTGRVTTNMPWTSFEYWAMTQKVNLDDFTLTSDNTTSLSETAPPR